MKLPKLQLTLLQKRILIGFAIAVGVVAFFIFAMMLEIVL